MLQSLLIKLAMLAVTVALVLWMGWPVPREATPQAEPDQVQRPTTGPLSTAKTESRLDLNRATARELQTLPGIGEVLAQRMVDWRKMHGRYRTVEDLGDVKGIGRKRLEQLRPLVMVHPKLS